MGLEEFARAIYRAVSRQTVALRNGEIFLAMSRRCVNRARPLFQRHVIAQNPQGFAIEKRMLENGAFQMRPGEGCDHPRRNPTAALGRSAQKIFRDDVDVSLRRLRRRVDVFRIEGDSQIGRQRPGRGGPDESKNALAGE